jgi:uncharacterized cupredoxin-like copper-binding protein
MIIIGAVIVVIIIAAVYVFSRPPPDNGNGDPNGNEVPEITIILYGGEINVTAAGFGLSADNITTPGPLLELVQGQLTNITFINSGQMPHSFAIADAPEENAQVLFGANVGSASVPIVPNGRGSVIFTPDMAGDYYYICPIPGHVHAGMWGNVTITPP